MKELLRKDLKLKLISLAFALLLWFFVVNSINPIETKSIPVPLSIKNISTLQDKNLMLNSQNLRSSVIVKVRGRRDVLRDVNENSFMAVLDFSNIKSDEDKELKIDDVVYLGSENIVIESVDPGSVKLDLKKIGQNTFAVEIPDVKTKEGYVLYDTYTNPTAVLVEGEASSIKRIAELRAKISIEEPIDRTVTIPNVECIALDENGEQITGLRIENVEVVLSVAKYVDVSPEIEGTPAEDYADGAVTVAPKKIRVTANDPSLLASTTSIKTELIDISNQYQTVSKNVPLVPPEGIRLVDPAEEVLVTVEIGRLAEKEFNVTADSIEIANRNIVENLVYSINTESIIIKVKGKRTELNMLYISDLKPHVDVQGLGEGTHQVPLQVTLSGVNRLVGEYSIEVKVEKPPAEPEATGG